MDAAPESTSLIVGAVLVEAGLIEVDQLERALALQVETGERLGEIVIAEFGVSRLELATVLAEQRAEYERPAPSDGSQNGEDANNTEPEPSAAAPPPRRIGEIFVEQGSIDRQTLEAALEVQQQTGGRIGEILVSQGVVTRLHLASALAEQWSAIPTLRPPQPHAERGRRQTDAPTDGSVATGWTEEARTAVAELDQRLQTVESAATATPWQDDIRVVEAELRSTITGIETKLESQSEEASGTEIDRMLQDVSSRVDALEGAGTAIDFKAVRRELDELKQRAVPAEALADLRSAVENLQNQPDVGSALSSLEDRVAAVTAELEVTATATTHDISARIDDLVVRLDTVAAATPPELDGIADRIDSLEQTTVRGHDLSVLEGRLARLEDHGVAPAEVDALRDELQRVTENVASEQQSLAAALLARLDEATASTPSDGDVRELREQLDELAGRPDQSVGLQARIDDITLRLEGLCQDQRLDHISQALEELGAVHAANALAVGARLASVDETITSLTEKTARMPEVTGEISCIEDMVSRVDRVEARLDALTALEERVAELAAERDSALAGELKVEFEGRLDEMREAMNASALLLAGDLGSRIDMQRAALSTTSDRIDDLQKAASEHLAAESRLETMLEAQLEQQATVAPVQAHVEVLGAELHQVVAALDSRLGDLEASRPAVDTGSLESAVAELARGIEMQHAIGEEQTRATERAIRTGLASLAKNVTRKKSKNSKHSKSRKGLRRSIERLGAAVVEADARLAGAWPEPVTKGCLAFAPTSSGYRLVEFPGSPPEVGATIKLKSVKGPLVVTRLGLSPLPFDGRPCVYLSRA